jgi:hypothetical protein
LLLGTCDRRGDRLAALGDDQRVDVAGVVGAQLGDQLGLILLVGGIPHRDVTGGNFRVVDHSIRPLVVSAAAVRRPCDERAEPAVSSRLRAR